jgi:hypothetical protein
MMHAFPEVLTPAKLALLISTMLAKLGLIFASIPAGIHDTGEA